MCVHMYMCMCVLAPDVDAHKVDHFLPHQLLQGVQPRGSFLEGSHKQTERELGRQEGLE